MLVNGKQGNLISVRDLGLLSRDGVFRTPRASHGKAQHWPLHYQILQQNNAVLGIRRPDFALLSADQNGLLPQYSDGDVKLIITRCQDELFVMKRIFDIWTIRDLDQQCLSDFSITAKIRHDLNVLEL